ncbi:hypothetical protein B0T10DRAFT_601112 [Thelonectria olida]|uniref:Uncharacterized protein n=1 Tax=Thelonectria olida TaxID=1576542 RepID=A0A9P9AXT2_9HYPO|nr:hypothetical protein B0T10DRAFT_601112 [Thelonectria olida]
MLKRQRQPNDRGNGEEEQSWDGEDLTESPTPELDPLFTLFQLERGYPKEKLDHLACPVYKLHSEKYICKVAPCQGFGFKNFKELNEHIERTHKPRGTGKIEVPRIESSEAYDDWDKVFRRKSRTGRKMSADEVRQKWWDMAQALELVRMIPSPLPQDKHLVFPGPDLDQLHLFSKWLEKCGMRLTITSTFASGLPIMMPNMPEPQGMDSGVTPTGRMTVAERLDTRPKPDVDYIPNDSAYGSLETNKDRADEEVVNDGESHFEGPQEALLGMNVATGSQFGVSPLLGTFWGPLNIP